MSNDIPRQPGEADGVTTEPERATPADDSAALPIIAASTDSDASTEEQWEANAAVLGVLMEGGLVIDVRDKDGKLRKTPIGKAVDILFAQGALTEDMAKGLRTIYEKGVARLGETEQSPEYKSVLEAIQRGTRKTLYGTSSEGQEKSPFYGHFSYAVDLRGKLRDVSIIEAIAWLEYTDSLSAAEAYRLRTACRANMQQVPYRKTLDKNLTPEEIKKELEELDEKTREITDPTNGIKKIADLEAQLNEGDFTFHVNWRSGNSEDVGILAGIFYHRQDNKLNTGPAMRLTKKCIDEMLRRNHGKEEIIDEITWIHGAKLINDDELRKLLGCIITDPDELKSRIRFAVDLNLDGLDDEGGNEEGAPPIRDDDGRVMVDGPPVPVAFVDTRQAKTMGVRPPGDTPSYPEISRLITGRRLALAAFGLLAIASAAGIVTSVKRAVTNTTDTTVAVELTSTEQSEGASEASTGAPRQDKAEAKKKEPATAAKEAPSKQGAASTPAAPAPTPTPQATPGNLTGAPPLVPLTAKNEVPQSITIPVTIKQSSSGSLKIDTTDEARAVWVNMGYIVSVSMGLNGKIIRLTDAKGNVYQVETENLTASTTELPAILRAAQ